MKFRLKALQRMREPDELDSPTLLASPRGWIATFVVLIVVVAAGVWSFVGRLPVTVTAKGLLTHPAGTAQLQSPYTGTVRTMMVSPGLRVVRGQAVAEVLRADGTVRTVSSPFSGEVVTTSASEGAMVREGDGLLAMERTDAPATAWSRCCSCRATTRSASPPAVRWTSRSPTPRPACSGCCAAG